MVWIRRKYFLSVILGAKSDTIYSDVSLIIASYVPVIRAHKIGETPIISWGNLNIVKKALLWYGFIYHSGAFLKERKHMGKELKGKALGKEIR